ncbi:MAG: hypothetical protein WDZ91_06830 [Paenibacillaceae bacterium]
MLKKTVSFLAIMTISFSLCLSSYAAPKDKVLKGTWSRGEVTQDSIPAFSGTKTDSFGNTTSLNVSPFNNSNIITNGQIINNPSNSGGVSTNDWWDSPYFYEYISNSYTQTSSSNDPYHYLVGQTQAYNGTSSPATLSYTQASSTTSHWSVTSQVSATADLKTNYLQKLSLTLGGTYTNSNTTTSSTTILYTISVSAGKTGYIFAWLPGGYSYGTAKYKEYLYSTVSGQFYATGTTVTTNEGGWSPTSNSSVTVLNFTSTQI